MALTEAQAELVRQVESLRNNVEAHLNQSSQQSENVARQLISSLDELGTLTSGDDYEAGYGDGAAGTLAKTVTDEVASAETVITELCAVCDKTRDEIKNG